MGVSDMTVEQKIEFLQLRYDIIRIGCVHGIFEMETIRTDNKVGRWSGFNSLAYMLDGVIENAMRDFGQAD